MQVKFECQECGTICDYYVALDDDYGVSGSPTFDTVEKCDGCDCDVDVDQQVAEKAREKLDFKRYEKWLDI